DPSVKETGTAKVFIGTLLMQLGLCVPMLINGFGEEFGWRGYLTPKLEKLMPTAPAVAVTGVIWAVWHAPLIWYGYDFGRDYPGFPYVGILFMCIGCVFASVPLTYLTKKTGSVLPAAIFHIVLDNCMTLPIGLFINAEQMGKYSHIAGLVILSVPGIIAGVMILIAEKRSKKAAQAA
ncbi:MAG: CPBP family intramembrane metalloprotease, partial [Ruminococcus sp.]|nr:CPBP family intramembrane metalloprotease [Ruminococcus sp.]